MCETRLRGGEGEEDAACSSRKYHSSLLLARKLSSSSSRHFLLQTLTFMAKYDLFVFLDFYDF